MKYLSAILALVLASTLSHAQNFPGDPPLGSLYVGTGSGPPTFTLTPTIPGPLTIDLNAAALPTFNFPPGGFAIKAGGADNNHVTEQLFAFGTAASHNATPHIAYLAARGTAAAPTAIGTTLGGNVLDNPTGDYSGFIAAYGYGASTYALMAGIGFRPTELQTATANGGSVSIATTPNGTAITQYTAIFDQDASLQIIGNSTYALTTPLQATPSGTLLHITGSNSIQSIEVIDAFGTGHHSDLVLRSARGTLLNPSATQSGDIIGFLNFTGYGTSQYAAYGTSGAAIVSFALENFSNTQQGTTGAAFATSVATTALAEAFRWFGNKSVSIGSTVNPGANNLSVAGAVIAPVVAGGSGAASTLTLESTSAAGTTDSIIFQTASQVIRGRILSNGQINLGTDVAPAANVGLTINKNAATPAAAVGGSTALFQISSADGVQPVAYMDSFGASSSPFLIARHAPGTGASFTATQSGEPLGFFGMIGASGANTFIASDASKGGVYFGAAATENWSGTNQGAEMRFYTTPNTTAAVALAGRFENSGGFAVGSGTPDPGVGSLGLSGQEFMPNITTTSVAQTGTVCWTTGTGKFTVDTTVACLASVEEAKNIVAGLTPRDALDLVSRLEPFSFRYKTGWGDGGKYEQFGLGAHQVASVDERLVGRDSEGTLHGVRYQELTAVLAAAIQALKADNDNIHRELDRRAQ